MILAKRPRSDADTRPVTAFKLQTSNDISSTAFSKKIPSTNTQPFQFYYSSFGFEHTTCHITALNSCLGSFSCLSNCFWFLVIKGICHCCGLCDVVWYISWRHVNVIVALSSHGHLLDWLWHIWPISTNVFSSCIMVSMGLNSIKYPSRTGQRHYLAQTSRKPRENRVEIDENRKGMLTAPGIPKWSPTLVLPRPDDV